MSDRSVEVAIIGGGPVGLTAAIALAGAGVETALVARPAGAPDNRTTALLASSVTALDTLGVWQHCRDAAAPLRVMRIIDDTARLLRAPEVHFAAGEIGLDAFGYNIENRFLIAALDTRARALPALTFIADDARAVAIEADRRQGGVGEQRRARRQAGDRSRRTPFPLPERRRHRDRWEALSADRPHLQSRPPTPAPGQLDGIPYAERALHLGAAARTTLEPGDGGRSGRGHAHRGAPRA